MVALIPARSGSKRVPGKNIRPLAGHPVLGYTIRAAVDSGVFADVIVSTDSEAYADVAQVFAHCNGLVSLRLRGLGCIL